MKELIEVQKELKAPKSQYNSFGKYNYRNAEDILEAVKPLLEKNGLTATITDDIVPVGNRVYVKATVTVTNSSNETISVSAFAREEEVKKGMDAAQITGSASSYARKYALNGMFLIDDTKDPDSQDNRGQGSDSSGKPKGGANNSGKEQNKNPPPQQKKNRFTPEQGAEVNHLLNDFGAFTEEEKNQWREDLKAHKEWTAEQFIGILRDVVDRNATVDRGEWQ